MDDFSNTIKDSLRNKKSVSRIAFIQTVYSLIFHYRGENLYSVEDVYFQRDYVTWSLSQLYDRPYKINTSYLRQCLDFFFNHKSAIQLYYKEVMRDKYHVNDTLILSVLYCFITEAILFYRNDEKKFPIIFSQYINISDIFLDKRDISFCTLCLNVLHEKIDSIRF